MAIRQKGIAACDKGRGGSSAVHHGRDIFDQAPVGMVLIDLDSGIILQANRCFADLVDRSAADLASLDWMAISHPDDRAVERKQMALLRLEEIKDYRLTKRFVRPDGAVTWAALTVARMNGATAPIPLALACVEDIGERRREEESLRSSEERYRLLADHSVDVIWTMNLAGETTYISPSVERNAGYTPEEYLRLPPSKTLTPAAYDLLQAALTDARAKVRAGLPAEIHLELENRTKRGDPLWWEIIASANYDAQGHFIELAGVSRNITKRVGIEERLRESEAKFRALVETTSDVIWEVDARGCVTYLSPVFAEISGVAPETLLGVAVADFPRQSLVFGDINPLLSALASAQPFKGFEVGIRHRDGRRLTSEWSGVPVVSPAGEFHGMRGIIRDISIRKQAEEEIQALNASLEKRVALRTAALEAEIGERRRAEQALRESEQRYRELNANLESQVAERTAEARAASAAKSEFLAHMSHEIRTPLYSVLGLAQMVNREPLSANQQGMIARIQEAGHSLLGIINDIQDLSRIEAGKIQIEHRPFDLAALLAKIADLHRPKARAGGLGLRIEASDQPLGPLLGDALRLEQVFTNLIGNAIKFTERGEVILRLQVLTLDNANARLRFEVHDSGIGMPPSLLACLFTPFTQGDAGITRRFGGTGLGLAISKRLVTLMGGEIGATSQPGLGSTFWFELPFSRVSAPARQGLARAVTAAGPRLLGRHFLVVDDTDIHRELMQQALEQEGARVTLAQHGQAAIESLAASPLDFDAVLMDVQMPVMDGLSATRLIRGQLGLGALPVIALTAGVLPEQRQAARAAGCDALLTKPVDLDQVAALLQQWLPRADPSPPDGGPSAAGPDRAPEATPAPAPATRPGSDTESFPYIPGIDPFLAARQFRGNLVMFTKFLTLFARDYAGVIVATRQALARGEREEAAHIMHQLRGYASTIAAMDLREAAGKIEDAIRQGVTVLEDRLDALERQVGDLIEASAPWRSAELEPGGNGDPPRRL